METADTKGALVVLNVCPRRSASADFLFLDWCYQSQVTCNRTCFGPEKWNKVATSCEGRVQSPINIVTRKTLLDERLTAFKFTGYKDTFQGQITNNGHTVFLAACACVLDSCPLCLPLVPDPALALPVPVSCSACLSDLSFSTFVPFLTS
ncbi:hypothetical protein GJAV_G00059660 [Gymnothorax javanicus]|nr:hypothetical protein GJAV_G00059660 [Gymnothorax javanicus]